MTDYKKENNFLKAELCHPFIKYAITINPCDERQCLDVENRVTSMEGYVNTALLKYYQKFSAIELYMEVSPKGRLHFHGTIMFYCYGDVKRFYLEEIFVINKKFNIDIDTIKDPVIWDTYCKKQNHLFPNVYRTNNLHMESRYGAAPASPPTEINNKIKYKSKRVKEV